MSGSVSTSEVGQASSSKQRDKRRSGQGSDQPHDSPSPPPALQHRRRGSIQMLLRTNSRSGQSSCKNSEATSMLFASKKDASVSSPTFATSSTLLPSPIQGTPIARSRAAQSRSATPAAPRPPSQEAIPSSLADRTPQRPHRPPPNSWLSRSSSKTLGRKRSGSLGTVEDRTSIALAYESHSASLTRTLSSSSAISNTSLPKGSPTRDLSSTWSRFPAPLHRRGSSPVEQSMLVSSPGPSMSTPAPPSPSLSSSSSGRRPRPRTMATLPDKRDLIGTIPSGHPSMSVCSGRGSNDLLSADVADKTGLVSADGKKASSSRKAGKLLKKIRSRSLLPAQDANDALAGGIGDKSSTNESTDSLVSSSTRDSSTSNKGGWANNAFERALPGWLTNKNRRGGDSLYHNGVYTSSTRTPVGSPSTPFSILAADTSRSAPVASEHGKPDSEPEEIELLGNEPGGPLPGRLSSWILNVLGSEASSQGAVGDAQASDGSGELVGNATRRRADQATVDGDKNIGKAVSRKSSAPTIVTSTLAKAALKPSGLLASFSSSARARAAAAAGTVAATAGLHPTGEAQEAEIWLLGVRHGPCVIQTSPGSAAGETYTSIATQEGGQRAHPALFPREEGNNASRCLSPASRSSFVSVRSNDQEQLRGQKSVGCSLDSCHVPDSSDFSLCDLGSSLRSGMTSATISSTPSNCAAASSTSDWQANFQLDFNSRIWCSYRSHFPPLARDGTIAEAAESADASNANGSAASIGGGRNTSLGMRPSTPDDTGSVTKGHPTIRSSVNSNGWRSKKLVEAGTSGETLAQAYTLSGALSTSSPSQSSGLGPPASSDNNFSTMSLGEKMGITGIWGRATAAVQAAGLTSRAGLTTDAGWGCMLRTGQSLLANALIEVHLGREWRRNLSSISLSAEHNNDYRSQRKVHRSYVQILSWFMDDPSAACPFSVHRMAREGKRLGKEVGEWFGPSTAAGAIKRLVEEFPQAQLGVSLASDGVVYLSEVRGEARYPAPERDQESSTAWQRPVLVLIGLRLGLEGVNAMYHDAIKAIFAFPQTVGIAGGRPSSSYYFVGLQGDSLLYLDPHTVRPAVTFRSPHHGLDTVPSQDLTPRNEEVGQQAGGQDEWKDWWLSAYTDSELATFHCDRPKRMPMRSLDPSMLLGFLIKDEDSMQDFITRVKHLPKAIFAIQDELPRWMKGEDEDDFAGSEGGAAPSLESFSESSFMADDEYDSRKREVDDRTTIDASNEQKARPLGDPTSSPDSETDDSAMVDEGYASDVTRPIGKGTVCFPEKGASLAASKSRAAGPLSTVTEGLRQVFPLLLPSSYEGANEMTAAPSESDGPVNLETPRYQSELRFPSTTSTFTATETHSRQSSNARQTSDQFVSISRSEASEDNGAAASSSLHSSAELISAPSKKPEIEEENKSSRSISSSGPTSIPVAPPGSRGSFVSSTVRQPIKVDLQSTSTSDGAFGTSWEEVESTPVPASAPAPASGKVSSPAATTIATSTSTLPKSSSQAASIDFPSLLHHDGTTAR